MAEKVSNLTEADWKLLIPKKMYKLGGQVEIPLRPVNLEELSVILDSIEDFKPVITEKGITRENYTDPENLFALATLAIKKIPGIVASSSSLTEQDIKDLPLEAVVGLIGKLIELNLESKEGLLKNLTALAEMIQPE